MEDTGSHRPLGFQGWSCLCPLGNCTLLAAYFVEPTFMAQTSSGLLRIVAASCCTTASLEWRTLTIGLFLFLHFEGAVLLIASHWEYPFMGFVSDLKRLGIRS